MGIRIIGRAAGVAVLCLGLAACIDVEMELQVLDEERARSTMVMAMDRQFYDMSLMDESGGEGFCDDGELTLTETVATCTEVDEATFEEMHEGAGDDGPTIVAEGNGLVRVSIPTGALSDEIGGGAPPDPETAQMMQAIFAGRTVTIRVLGVEVVESNMTITGDGAAELVIPFTELLDGAVNIPDPAYALVRVR